MSKSQKTSSHLAACWWWYILTLSRLLPTTDVDILPGPIRACSFCAQNVDIRASWGDSSGHPIQCQTGDRHTSSWCSSRWTILIILFNDNTICWDIVQNDSGISHALDRTCCTRHSLDTNTVGRINDLGIRDSNIADVVVTSATNWTNWDSVTTSTTSSSECDIRSRIDSHTIILIVNDCVWDNDASRGSNIESISVVASFGITIRAVDRDMIKSKIFTSWNRKPLNWSVLDIQSRDWRWLEIGFEELWLVDATIATFPIPPLFTTSINEMIGCTGDSLTSSTNLNEWTSPCFETKRRCSGENDLQFDQEEICHGWNTYVCIVSSFCKVKSLSSRNSNVAQHNCLAGFRRSSGSWGIGESTCCSSLDFMLMLGWYCENESQERAE